MAQPVSVMRRVCTAVQARALWLLLAAAPLSGGCYRFVPVEPAVVQPQEEVRVRVTDDAAVRLAREFGRITSELDGQLMPGRADSVEVSVWIGRNYPGTQFENVKQTVVLGRQELVEVQRRQLAPGRTVLVTAGTVAIFAVLVKQLIQQEDPNTPPRDDGTNPPPGMIRIPFGFGGGR